jgi:hypothetical protein
VVGIEPNGGHTVFQLVSVEARGSDSAKAVRHQGRRSGACGDRRHPAERVASLFTVIGRRRPIPPSLTATSICPEQEKRDLLRIR